MRIIRWIYSEVLISISIWINLLWTSVDTRILRHESDSVLRNYDNVDKDNEKFGKVLKSKKPVTEEEISYIASTLQPRECLSLLYLLHHGYNQRRRRRRRRKRRKKRKRRRRRREIAVEKPRNKVRSAQITPCETMLLNYWRDPRSRLQKDCSHISQNLREVKRQDLARWLCGRRPSCYARTMILNGTNDPSSITAKLQVIRPIYPHGTSTSDRTLSESTFDSIIWIYIALAVCATTTVLLCLHYLFKKFRRSSKYIALDEKDIRNMQYSCGCIAKRLSLPCNKKKRYQPPERPCACLSN